MADIGFIWDEAKYHRVLARHSVRFHEVVAAFDDSNGHEVQDPTGPSDRWVWVGKSTSSRLLVVVYSDEELPLYRLITAFDANELWREAYENELR